MPGHGPSRSIIWIGGIVVVLVGLGVVAFMLRDRAAPGAGDAPVTMVASLPLQVGDNVEPPVNPGEWTEYDKPRMGIRLRAPSDWRVVDETDGFGLKLYPPESDPAVPSPFIAISYADDAFYDAQASAPAGVTPPRPVTVAGTLGRRYEDMAAAAPTQNVYVDVPYRGGTLFITATIGPGLNLTPVLDDLLPSLKFRQ